MNGELDGEVRSITVADVAAEAQTRGVTLMVKSLLPPFYSVEYPEFAQQVLDRQAARGEQSGSIPGLMEEAAAE